MRGYKEAMVKWGVTSKGGHKQVMLKYYWAKMLKVEWLTGCQIHLCSLPSSEVIEKCYNVKKTQLTASFLTV